MKNSNTYWMISVYSYAFDIMIELQSTPYLDRASRTTHHKTERGRSKISIISEVFGAIHGTNNEAQEHEDRTEGIYE